MTRRMFSDGFLCPLVTAERLQDRIVHVVVVTEHHVHDVI